MDITQQRGEDDLAFLTSVVVDETSSNSDVQWRPFIRKRIDQCRSEKKVPTRKQILLADPANVVLLYKLFLTHQEYEIVGYGIVYFLSHISDLQNMYTKKIVKPFWTSFELLLILEIHIEKLKPRGRNRGQRLVINKSPTPNSI